MNSILEKQHMSQARRDVRPQHAFSRAYERWAAECIEGRQKLREDEICSDAGQKV